MDIYLQLLKSKSAMNLLKKSKEKKMKKSILLFVLMMAMSFAFAENLIEGFEGAFPAENWQNNAVTGDKEWIQVDYKYHNGTHSIRFSNNSGGEAELITPRLDLTASNSDQLQFWLITDQYDATYSCNLKVYISTDGGNNYTLLQTYDSNITSFTEETIDLETGIEQTDNAYIKFLGYDNYSDGLFIDDITAPQFYEETLPVTLTCFSGIQTNNNSISLTWTAESETSMLGYKIYRTKSDFENSDFVSRLITAQNLSHSHTYTFEDKEVENGNTYTYRLESIELDGTSLFYERTVNILFDNDGDNSEIETPQIGNTCLKGNYPNPFNPETTIRFFVAEGENATLSLFNVKGEKILSENFSSGNHSYLWNAKGLSSGLYFYQLKSISNCETKRMMLLK